MMEILFRRPELDDRETILKHLSERRLRGCERTFANVYLWARFYNEGWADAAIFGGETGFFRSFLLPFLAETFRDFAYLARRGEAGTVAAGIRYRYLQRRSLYRGRRDNSKREARVLCR